MFIVIPEAAIPRCGNVSFAGNTRSAIYAYSVHSQAIDMYAVYDCGFTMSHSLQVVNCSAENIDDLTVSHPVSHHDSWSTFLFYYTM